MNWELVCAVTDMTASVTMRVNNMNAIAACFFI